MCVPVAARIMRSDASDCLIGFPSLGNGFGSNRVPSLQHTPRFQAPASGHRFRSVKWFQSRAAGRLRSRDLRRFSDAAQRRYRCVPYTRCAALRRRCRRFLGTRQCLSAVYRSMAAAVSVVVFEVRCLLLLLLTKKKTHSLQLIGFATLSVCAGRSGLTVTSASV